MSHARRATSIASTALALCLAGAPARSLAQGARYFTVRVVDGAGAPVAGVRLRTTNDVVLTTDTRGVAAFYEPGLMGRSVWFDVTRPGYEVAPAAFGFRGRALTATEGATGTITITRTSDPDPGPPAGLSDAESRLAAAPVPSAAQRFRIRVQDSATGRGIPLVEVRSPGRTEFTDSAGLLGFYDIDRMGTALLFVFRSDGYALDDDALGAGMRTLRADPGAAVTIGMHRTGNVAERLYRITGQGIYRESALLGAPAPTALPLLNGAVMGQDSALTTVYRGRVFWVWGDTNRPEFPLGTFQAPGATSRLPADGGLDPAQGVDLTYFTGTDGFARGLAPRDERGPTWLDGLLAVPDGGGTERLFATYGVYPSLAPPVEAGLLRFDDATSAFVRVHTFSASERAHPAGWALRARIDGREYAVYANRVRVPAQAEALTDPARWEAYSPFGPDGALQRQGDGAPSYAWRANAPTAGLDDERPAGVDAAHWLNDHAREPDGEERAVDTHGAGHAAFNPHRARYTRFVNGTAPGESFDGDVWYQEADSVLGPWVYAQRVVAHPHYTFYNPRQHPFFAQQGGRVVYFEGTYTTSFSDAPSATPRYNYNQVMYRLDLDDPRMALPVPVYNQQSAANEVPELLTRAGLRPRHRAPRAGFYAPDRRRPGTSPVYWTGACAPRDLVAREGGAGAPVFYAFAPDASARPRGVVALYRYRGASGGSEYAVEAQAPAGASRDGSPVAYVWPQPVATDVDVLAELDGFLADAGVDRCEREARAGQGAQVALDAAGSRAPAGARYAWRAGGVSALGLRATVTLPAGVNVVTLTVSDPATGETREDEQLVEVVPASGMLARDAGGSADASSGGGADGGCACRARRASRSGRHAGLAALLGLSILRRARGRARTRGGREQA